MVNLLEESDKYLMRNLFDSEMGTPVESFYIETSSIPFRFIVQGRRIMFYWTILKESELAKQVFSAQQEFPEKNDWFSQVLEDLLAFEIFQTESEIKKMSKYKIKKLFTSKLSRIHKLI